MQTTTTDRPKPLSVLSLIRRDPELTRDERGLFRLFIPSGRAELFLKSRHTGDNGFERRKAEEAAFRFESLAKNDIKKGKLEKALRDIGRLIEALERSVILTYSNEITSDRHAELARAYEQKGDCHVALADNRSKKVLAGTIGKLDSLLVLKNAELGAVIKKIKELDPTSPDLKEAQTAYENAARKYSDVASLAFRTYEAERVSPWFMSAIYGDMGRAYGKEAAVCIRIRDSNEAERYLLAQLVAKEHETSYLEKFASEIALANARTQRKGILIAIREIRTEASKA